MIEFYGPIKTAHIALAMLVGTVFLTRFLAAAVAPLARWRQPLRYLSWAVDVSLLTAAMMLLTILPSGLFANGWLAVKLGLLGLFVLARHWGLRPHQSTAGRWVGFVAGCMLYLQAYFVARTHHPWGLGAYLTS